MTEGETRFYLREIHAHWATSHLSAEKLAELKAARLIESNGAAVSAVRLTNEGARYKTSLRRQGKAGGINLTGKAPARRRWTARKTMPRVQPLV